MKNKTVKSINYLGILFALLSSEAYSGVMGPPPSLCAPGQINIGVFGGAGTSTKIDISQFGTAYYFEAAGGPLAVNAFGKTNHRTAGLVGGYVGYEWSEILLNSFNSQLSLSPAVQLEGYYLGKSNFTGHDVNNNTTRLPEHDFVIRYPISTGVFLTNAVLNINLANFSRLHPYVAAGIGGSIISISNASATQIAPPEPGINHYNSKASDKQATFAGQTKVGLNIDLSSNASIFVEYRWLYLAGSSYNFGSTVYPGHPTTSNWLVKIDPQSYNMGAVGIQYSI